MSYSQIVLDDGPVFYHRFLPGSWAYDSTLNGDNNVTSRSGTTAPDTGSPIEDTPSYTSSNGSGYLTISGNTVSPSGDFTVEAWVRYTSLATNQFGIAISKGAAAADRTFLFGTRLNGGGKFYFGVWDSNRVERIAESNVALNDGQWHHLVGVIRGTTIELWVDGELNSSNPFVDYPPAASTGPYEYFQYGQGSYTSYRFRGDLASPAVYHRALTKSEIQTHYKAASDSVGTLNGVTNINTVPSECAVRVYERETGNLIADLLSDDITGEYTAIVPLSGQYDIVCIGDETVCPQISGPLTPTPIETVSSFVGFPVLKLEFNGGDGSTTITDSSPYSRACSRFGNAVQSDTQVRSGVSSLFLDGSGDYIRVTNGLDFFTITNDFTIEAWIYRTSASVTDRDTLIANYSGTANDGFTIQTTTDGTLYIAFGIGGSYEYFRSNSVIPLNQWVHIAVCREGNNIRVYVNGIKESDGTLVGTPTSYSGYIYIGRDNLAHDRDFHGYIDSVKLTQGYAKYTDDFTPV